MSLEAATLRGRLDGLAGGTVEDPLTGGRTAAALRRPERRHTPDGGEDFRVNAEVPGEQCLRPRRA